LRAEVGRLRGVALLECAAIEAPAVVAAPEPGADGELTPSSCDDGEERCLAQLGQTCGATQVVYGTVGTMVDSYVLDLKLIDVGQGDAAGRSTVSLSGDQEVLIDGVRVALTKLVAPEQYLGSFELRLELPGAEVYLDGEKVGVTPLERIGGLTPGEHQLRVVIEDYEALERPIDIYFARTTVLNVSLSGKAIDVTVQTTVVEARAPTEEDAPAPITEEASPLDSPLLLGGALAAGTGIAVLLVSGVGWILYASAYADMAGVTSVGDDGKVLVDDADAYDGFYEQAKAGWNIGIFAGVAGGLLLATGAGIAAAAVLMPGDLE